MFVYEINGKKYVQTPLVWGQVRQLMNLLKGLEIPTGAGAMELIDVIGEKLPQALAIVLTEEGTSVKNKDLTALASEFDFDIPLGIMIKVIEDFFECNPTASYLETVARLIGGITGQTSLETPLKKSESSSAEETLPSET